MIKILQSGNGANDREDIVNHHGRQLRMRRRDRNLGMRSLLFVCKLLNVPATCECISGTEEQGDRHTDGETGGTEIRIVICVACVWLLKLCIGCVTSNQYTSIPRD